MKPRKPDETDAEYIRRLEDANAELKRQNDTTKKWGNALNEAVTTLSCDASLAFQAMAEKAGVRSHPSVTAVVELFDAIAHPQWRGEKIIPKVKFPQFWDLDGPTAWSGDADMQLNSPIADAIELLAAVRFSVKKGVLDDIAHVVEGLQKALRDGVEGVKTARGFKPKHVALPTGHTSNMSAEELREIISAIGYMALDLAQDMNFANECLRRDLRASTYRRVCADLYRLAWMGPEIPENTNFSIKIIGGEQDKF